MTDLNRFKDLIEQELKDLGLPASPENLYRPMEYILQLGGKRIRPAAVLLANRCFGGVLDEAMPVALAVEVFHNFTLMHDDIMDEAPVRRGKTTVHKKWNTTIAILSGDAMMVKAYQLLEGVNPIYLPTVFSLFNKTALEVCEGQQLDMDFESQVAVGIDDYLEMIRLKTAVLLAASLQLGAITANASANDQQHIYEFGINLGLAFQLQDDLLDCFADADKFGKQVGGDILENKKTFLLLKAIELANSEQKNMILKLISDDLVASTKKVESMLAIYADLGIEKLTRQKVEEFTEKAIKSLEKLSLSPNSVQFFKDLANFLLARES